MTTPEALTAQVDHLRTHGRSALAARIETFEGELAHLYAMIGLGKREDDFALARRAATFVDTAWRALADEIEAAR